LDVAFCPIVQSRPAAPQVGTFARFDRVALTEVNAANKVTANMTKNIQAGIQ
jgi:hypothetical protein